MPNISCYSELNLINGYYITFNFIIDDSSA